MKRLLLCLPLCLALLFAGGSAAVRRLGPESQSQELVRPLQPVLAASTSAADGRVVLVILDGLRRVDALDSSVMPFLGSVARKGSRGIIETGPQTFTQPCLRKMLTGQGSGLRDELLNQSGNAFIGDSLFDSLDRSGVGYGVTAFAPAIAQLFGEGRPEGSFDVRMTKQRGGDLDDVAGDDEIELAGNKYLADPSRRFIIIHFGGLDTAAHHHTVHHEVFERTRTSIDARVGRLAEQLDFTRDTILVLGDHGMTERGQHGGPEREARATAYVAAGPHIRKRSGRPLEQSDVADTMAALLGVCPPAGSGGAPDFELIDVDRRELKTRFDRCLVERMSASVSPGAAWLKSREAVRFAEHPEFDRAALAAYRGIVATEPSERWPGGFIFFGVGLLVAAVVVLLLNAPGWSGIIALLALSALAPFRTQAAIGVAGALLLIAAVRFYERPRWLLGLGALELLAAPLLDNPTPMLLDFARGVGIISMVLACVWLGREWVRTECVHGAIRPSCFVVLLPILAAWMRFVVPDLPTGVVTAKVLDLLTLGLGVVFFAAGCADRKPILAAIGSICAASCLFSGWPLAIFVVLELAVWVLSIAPVAAASTGSGGWKAAAGWLALFAALNAGYGFSRIDLSLMSVGYYDPLAISVPWAAAMIALSYLWPLLLLLRFARVLGGIAMVTSLGAVLGAALAFAGADLVLLTTLDRDRFDRVQLEEVLTFDMAWLAIACGVVLVAAIGGAVRARMASRTAGTPEGSNAVTGTRAAMA